MQAQAPLCSLRYVTGPGHRCLALFFFQLGKFSSGELIVICFTIKTPGITAIWTPVKIFSQVVVIFRITNKAPGSNIRFLPVKLFIHIIAVKQTR